MSTVTSPRPAPLTPITSRFLWKEYRTLRGMWLGVATLGVLAQWITAVLALPSTNLPPLLIGMGLGAAILNAVGATAVIFSAEHEEATYAFLNHVPNRWFPMFVGKWLSAAVTSLSLAVLLTLTGWLLTSWPAGSSARWPSPAETSQLLAILGVGIFEALAWGTLFSLLLKRPLVAAILTVLVGIVVAQLLVSSYSNGNLGAADPDAYITALPARLAIILMVLGLAMLRATKWLEHPRPRILAPPNCETRGASSITRTARRAWRKSETLRSMPALRLIWQTWRESWMTLLLPAALAVVLMLGVGAATSYLHFPAPAVFSAYFLPALYGAMVFSADQRRRQYAFLAEHAIPARKVWLIRHLVWGGLCTIWIVLIALVTLGFTTAQFYEQVQQVMFNENWRYSRPYEIAAQLSLPLEFLIQGAFATLTGALLAYAVGQLFSMLLRSEILASFAACVASIAVTAWTALMLYWQLNPLWSMLPIAVGCFAATWLRAPDWVIDRHAWRSWLRPAAAVAMPLLVVLLAIPAARLSQIPRDHLQSAEQVLMSPRAEFRLGDTAEARKTAEMYLQAADLMDAWQKDNPLERWNLDEPFRLIRKSREVLPGTGEMGEVATATFPSGGELGAVDLSEMSAEEAKDYEAAVKKYWVLRDAAEKAAVKEFLAASRRDSCRFSFDWTAPPMATSFPDATTMDRERLRLDPQYRRLIELTTRIANKSGSGAAGRDKLLAALQATSDLRDAQPTLAFVEQLSLETGVLQRIAQWATNSATTQDDIRRAIASLEKHFAHLPDPAVSLWADRELVAEVLAGKIPPLAFSYPPVTLEFQLTFLLHQLPWEQRRALLKLDLLTAADIRRVNSLLFFLRTNQNASAFVWPRDHQELRETLSGTGSGIDTLRFPRSVIPGGHGLIDREYDARAHARQIEMSLVSAEVQRRATLLHLALELYHREHDQYPWSLEKLAPNFLAKVPLDPYNGRQFQYLPRGADLPIEGIDSYSSNSNLFPAGQPVFWSVGRMNSTQFLRSSNDEFGYVGDRFSRRRVATPSYRFWSADNSNEFIAWPPASEIFPLPR